MSHPEGHWQHPSHVIPPRLELGTHSLEGCCSIQLSYGTKGIAKIVKKCDLVPLGQGNPEVRGDAEDEYQYGVSLMTEGGVQDAVVP